MQKNTNYAYDNRTQVADETSTRGAGYTDNFSYNGAGNPVSWKGQTRAFNLDNQETGGVRTYDGIGNTTQMPNGNLATPTTAAPTQKLSYNAQGQLSELRDAANVLIARYAYRGDGKRAWKEDAAGNRSYFYYSGDKMIAVSNGDNASTLLLWGADGLVGLRSSVDGVVSRFYHLYDPQGNLAQTVDENGAVVSSNAFGAWGEPLRDASGNASVGAFGYGAKFGYWRDGESGFYLCTLRYYDPSAGRWISRDPIGYAGGSDLYGYVGNDPVNAVDPSGLYKIFEPNTWFDGNGYQGSGLEVNADALHRGGLGAQAGVDGIIPFFDPFAHFGGYNPHDKDLQFSWKAGAFARDIYIGSKIPNLETWAKNPLMYEIGQKTLATAPKGGLTAIQMGQQLVKEKGLLKAIIPEGAGWKLGIGVTFGTGPTPGGWIGVYATGKAVRRTAEAACEWWTEP